MVAHGLIRDWLAPASATALVAWIVIPQSPVEPPYYEISAVAEHRACVLERLVKPRQGRSYSPEDLQPLIPTLGGRIRIVAGHECGQQMDFTHVIVEDSAGSRASIFVTRSPESSERRFRPRRVKDLEVTQVRTTRHRAFVVFDRDSGRELREWRALTLNRLELFMKQREAG